MSYKNFFWLLQAKTKLLHLNHSLEFILPGDVVWKMRACANDEIGKNPVMTFPIKKRTITELFIKRMSALYILESQIRDDH